ncbi:2Fe-2S iron-sulfur cluster binding domain-containing protein [Beggiatoa leptomitoformis]|nr:2Fe-2S iron-sulfur cluster binding domain-containing protein [Beggiatoa leptomitoformis]
MTHTIFIKNNAEQFPCQAHKTILQAMEGLGRKGIPIGCRGGGCGICKVHVNAGHYHTQTMSREHVSELEQKNGYALACRLYADSALDISVVGKLKKQFS